MSAVASARDIAVSASRLVLVESVDLPLQLIDLRLERVERLLGAAFGPCGGLTLRRPGGAGLAFAAPCVGRSEEHTSELQSLMRISYAVFCLQKKTHVAMIHQLIRTNTT